MEIDIFSDELKSLDIDLLNCPDISYQIRELAEFETKGLIYKNGSLLYQNEDTNMTLNWKKQINYHKAQKYKIKKQLLSRALGIKSGKSHIYDLTCGTAKDSILLVSFGARVTAFERNPYVYTLLKNELNNQDDEFKAKFKLNFGAFSKDILENETQSPDALYYDPMFTDTNRKKSALKRKEMVLFDDLVGKDEDAEIFLENLLTTGIKRIVVKRHTKSIDLVKGVNTRFEGKNIRYDLYC